MPAIPNKNDPFRIGLDLTPQELGSVAVVASKNIVHRLHKCLNRPGPGLIVKMSRARVILNSELAVDIYQHKLELMAPKCFKSCIQSPIVKTRGESIKLAVKYGVSAKAIRDIWNHKSWVKATMHLWTDKSINLIALQV